MLSRRKKLVAKSYYSWIEKKCLTANSVSRTDVNSIKHIKMNEKVGLIIIPVVYIIYGF